jgi:hypothetical protein
VSYRVLDVTEGLRCRQCGEDTVTETSIPGFWILKCSGCGNTITAKKCSL